MTLFNLLTGLLTILAIVGVILNIKKKKACFYIWTITNASWCVIDFYKDIPMQGVLFLIYTGLAVWGIFEWNNKNDD
ncbi:MAG: nicotinamide mononucleotide transporter [Desulfobacterales bacterium]|nr:nicotinamide mononucleotide transporter [Desulfobacterales bacterium]